MFIPPDTWLPAANYALAHNATFSTNLDTKRRVYLERHGGNRHDAALGTQSAIPANDLYFYTSVIHKSADEVV